MQMWIVCGGKVTAAQVSGSASGFRTIFWSTDLNDLYFSSCLQMMSSLLCYSENQFLSVIRLLAISENIC